VALATATGEWGYRMHDKPGGEIPVITMDRLCEEAKLDRIDVLKCDIERADAELFADCAGWILDRLGASDDRWNATST
jgi:FkbM family methyltransferase